MSEKLKEKGKIEISRATVRRALRGDRRGAKARSQRHYKRRERKEQEGELLLWDGSPHRLFGEKSGG
jgi:hypothetical protein